MTRWIALAALAGMMGCTAAGFDPAVQNPNTFTARVAQGTGVITGSYNENGFSQADVTRLLDALCRDGEISDYTETPDRLLNGFRATCSADIFVMHNVITVTRTSPTMAEILVRGSEVAGLYSERRIRVPLG